jgi:hypothetical protein
MNTVHRQRGQVLILIFGAMFLGGGLAAGVFSSGTALKDMKKDIKQLDLAAHREKQALDILEGWKDTVKPRWKANEKRVDELFSLLEKQHTPAATLEELFVEQAGDVAEAEASVLMLRDELRTVLNRDEWTRVFTVK